MPEWDIWNWYQFAYQMDSHTQLVYKITHYVQKSSKRNSTNIYECPVFFLNTYLKIIDFKSMQNSKILLHLMKWTVIRELKFHILHNCVRDHFSPFPLLTKFYHKKATVYQWLFFLLYDSYDLIRNFRGACRRLVPSRFQKRLDHGSGESSWCLLGTELSTWTEHKNHMLKLYSALYLEIKLIKRYKFRQGHKGEALIQPVVLKRRRDTWITRTQRSPICTHSE